MVPFLALHTILSAYLCTLTTPSHLLSCTLSLVQSRHHLAALHAVVCTLLTPSRSVSHMLSMYAIIYAEPAPPPEPGIKLSGSFKPAGQPKDDRFSINPTALVPPPRGPGPGAPPSAASPEGGTAGGAGRPGGKGGGIPVARGVSDDEEEADDGQAIPDEQTIKWV
eukprot:1161137-Pelagomonas_calceolata.AAC.1